MYTYNHVSREWIDSYFSIFNSWLLVGRIKSGVKIEIVRDWRWGITIFFKIESQLFIPNIRPPPIFSGSHYCYFTHHFTHHLAESGFVSSNRWCDWVLGTLGLLGCECWSSWEIAVGKIAPSVSCFLLHVRWLWFFVLGSCYAVLGKTFHFSFPFRGN